MKSFVKFKNWLLDRDEEGATWLEVIAACITSIGFVVLVGALFTWLSY